MRFAQAADVLQARGVTLDDMAHEFGVSWNTISRWKMESQRLKPREGWESVLADLAERRVGELADDAAALDQLARNLRGEESET